MVSVGGEIVDTLNVDTFLRGLPDLKGAKVIGKKVKNLFVVNFHVRAFHSELIGWCLDIFKEVLKQSWQNTSGLGVDIFVDIRKHTQNGISFAGSCLSIGEDGRVVALDMKRKVLKEFGWRLDCRSVDRVKIGRCLRWRWHQRRSTTFCWVLRLRVRWSLLMRGRRIEGTCFRGIKVWGGWQPGLVIICLFYCLISFNFYIATGTFLNFITLCLLAWFSSKFI